MRYIVGGVSKVGQPHRRQEMGGMIVLGVVVMMVGVVLAGLTLLTQTLPAAERISPAEKESSKENKKDSICVDVVLEEVDFSANTITARSTVYFIPPHDNVGGAVFKTGTTDSHQDKATKYVRLPVMTQAKLTEKKPKAGQHAILRLELLQQGLVVVGIEAFTGLERIGVDWPDAPRRKRRLRTRLPCCFTRSEEMRSGPKASVDDVDAVASWPSGEVCWPYIGTGFGRTDPKGVAFQFVDAAQGSVLIGGPRRRAV